MTTRDIERFFRLAAEHFPGQARILLFGGGAAIIQTQPRETLDLDMEILVEGAARNSSIVEPLVAALERAGQTLRIGVQAGIEIHRWSLINWGDYRNHQRHWKTFGGIRVSLLEPEYFALTKLSRASPVDLDDIRKVLVKHGGSWKVLAAACGRALRESPPSTAQDPFRRMVEHFLSSEGPRIWGKSYRSDDAIAEFRKAYARKPPAG